MKIEIKSVDELVLLIQVCAWAFVVVIVMLVFGGTVGSMLFSVIFVQQPIKSMAPIDQAFTKMLNDIVLLLAGSISTLVGMFAINKGAKAIAEKLAPSIVPPSTHCPNPQYAPRAAAPAAMPDFNWMGFKNPELDESWTPGPPPTTPPDHLEPDHEREHLAAAREQAE